MRVVRGAVAVVAMLVAAGCGVDDRAGDSVGTDRQTTSTAQGWVEGEPNWSSGIDGGDAAGASAYGAEDAARATAGSGEFSEGCCEPAPPGSGSPRAGSVDDNADFDGYLAYRERIRSLGIPIRDVDASGRIVLKVVGADGRPVHGADVSISGVERTFTTNAAGRVVFLPAASQAPLADTYTFTVSSESVTAAPGDQVRVQVPEDGGADPGVPLDVVFLIDVTGSMGDEIGQLQRTVSAVAARIGSLTSQPQVRFGMTLYRDEGDAFVTATFDLTDVIEDFQAALAGVVAGGGGDTPEALDEGFAEALAVPSWRDRRDAVQLVFLIADAAPQVGRRAVTPYTETMLAAAARGITVHAIAASNTDDAAEHAFRTIAQATDGRFVFLTYGAGGAATGARTDIARTDYEELSLDDLIVRLVSEQLDELTGTTTPAPTTTTTSPPGQ